MYIRPLNPSGELDGPLAELFQNARRRGHEPEEVLKRLEHLVRPRAYDRIVVADPECLCEADDTNDGWKDRVSASALVVSDVMTARELPAGCPAKVFRVIADSSIEELKQFCGA